MATTLFVHEIKTQILSMLPTLFTIALLRNFLVPMKYNTKLQHTSLFHLYVIHLLQCSLNVCFWYLNALYFFARFFLWRQISDFSKEWVEGPFTEFNAVFNRASPTEQARNHAKHSSFHISTYWVLKTNLRRIGKRRKR